MTSTSSHFNVGAQDEDNGEGGCPKAFAGAEPLMVSDVRILLEDRAKRNEKEEDEQILSQVFEKARVYCSRFGKFKSHAAIECVRSILEGNNNLTPFERVLLGNLVPESAEEAKSVIPSLDVPGKIDDDELQQILEDLKTTFKYQ